MEMREKSEEMIPQNDLTLNENQPNAETENVDNKPEPQPAPEAPAEGPVAEPSSEEIAEPVADEATNEAAPEVSAEVAPDAALEVVAETAAEPVAEVVETRKLPETIEEVIVALTELSEREADEISRDEVTRIRLQYYNLRKAADKPLLDAFVAEGNAPEAFVAPETEEDLRVRALLDTIKDKKAARLAEKEQVKQANYEAKEALINELNAMCEDVDNIFRQTPRVREIQAQFKTIGEVPDQLVSDQWKRYQEALEHFYDKLQINKELRDYDFKKNLEIKNALLEEAVALDAEEDVVVAFRKLQSLHDRWRETGPVAKEYRDEIWNKFKEASLVINKKHQAFFEQRKQEEAANEAAKTALCELIEAIDIDSLTNFNAWNETTKVVLQAQEDWKKLGFASRKSNNVLFARFRAVCDKFFARKAEYYRAVKDELSVNLEKKIALCEQAEALMDSTDWKATADKLVELQKQWKQIGAVAKKQSDAVWARFQKACDHFFELKKKDYNDARHAEQANLKAKRALTEQLRQTPADAPREVVLESIRNAQARWAEIGHVPFREKDKVYEEFRAAINELYKTHNLRENRDGMARFKSSIEEMSDGNKLSRERERLARVLESKRGELATYRNNLGFFNFKSASSSSMLREIERKTRRLEEDIRDLEQKIAMIDEKL